ncbi:MAG TPA: hypothetical protein VGC55_16800 [Dokdonella sp.]
MSRARIVLHLVALVAPILAAGAFCALLLRSETPSAWRQAGVLGGIGALAAQIAAGLCWRSLDRRARAGSGAWKTGLGMAALTHLLFGVLLTAALALSIRFLDAGDSGTARDLLLQAAFFALASLTTVGAVTLPLSAWLAQAIAALRRKEFADDAR